MNAENTTPEAACEQPSPIVLPDDLRDAIDRFGGGLKWVIRDDDGGVRVYSPSTDIFWGPEMWLKVESDNDSCFYGPEIFDELRFFCMSIRLRPR